MNKLIGGLALLFLVGGAGSSAHADGPWCAFYDVSTYNCGFYSFEQCYETVRGVGGSCRPNFFQNFGDGRPAGRRATQADVTDPCRTSGLRRAGKRGSTRSNTSWRCWDMRRRAISRLSATLLVAAALGLSVAAAHAGPCSSRIAQFEQAVRQSAGNPNAGPMAPQSIGAQLDANRRRPRSDAPRSRRRRRSRRPWRAPSVSINKEIELGVRGRWPPLSECTICSDPASRSSSVAR